MKKLWKSLAILIVFVSLCLGVIIVLSTSGFYEVKAVTDRYNPTVHEKNSYVKTKSPDSVEEHKLRRYKQEAVDKYGNSMKVEFTAPYELKTNHYLKIKHKGTHVYSYEEVKKSEVPNKTLPFIQ